MQLPRRKRFVSLAHFSGIPEHITGLPAEFLSTPLGHMIRPMIEAHFGPSSHRSLHQASKHQNVDLQTLKHLSESAPIHFTTSSNIELISKKLIELISIANVECSSSRLDDIIQFTSGKKSEFDEIWWEMIKHIVSSLNVNDLFPLLDILRLLLLKPQCRSFIIEHQGKLKSALIILDFFVAIISRITADTTNPTKLMLLRCVI